MNKQTRQRWSDLDLEKHHDGELSAQERAALTTDLFADEALRDRLDRIRALDELGRRALLAEVQPKAGVLPLSKGARRAILAAAAALALVFAGAATRTMWRRSPQPPTATSTPAPITLPTYSQERLALTIPVSAKFQLASLRSVQKSKAQALTPTPTPQDEAIQAALLQGRADDALRLLAKSTVRDRTQEWSKLGEMMQSAQRARSAILFLPVDQQIEIVRVWSRQPSLRPVVFERLEELLRDPASAPAARDLRAELEQNPQLTSWVNSYAAAR